MNSQEKKQIALHLTGSELKLFQMASDWSKMVAKKVLEGKDIHINRDDYTLYNSITTGVSVYVDQDRYILLLNNYNIYGDVYKALIIDNLGNISAGHHINKKASIGRKVGFFQINKDLQHRVLRFNLKISLKKVQKSLHSA
ncbi:MAG: hypothetical protein PF486_06040 [Prolixibacteraceae bacterium]|jgi:hypothetical protein|nr:hypothetical protein [Prolixibacteraceae bacterium]